MSETLLSKESHPHQAILSFLQRKGKAEQIAADFMYICTVQTCHIPLNFDLVQLQDFLFLQKRGHSIHIHKFIYRSLASFGRNVKLLWKTNKQKKILLTLPVLYQSSVCEWDWGLRERLHRHHAAHLLGNTFTWIYIKLCCASFLGKAGQGYWNKEAAKVSNWHTINILANCHKANFKELTGVCQSQTHLHWLVT